MTQDVCFIKSGNNDIIDNLPGGKINRKEGTPGLAKIDSQTDIVETVIDGLNKKRFEWEELE